MAREETSASTDPQGRIYQLADAPRHVSRPNAVAPFQTDVSGLPALPHRQSLREQAALRRLPDLVAQVRKLQEELAEVKRSIAKPVSPFRMYRPCRLCRISYSLHPHS